MRCPYYYRVIHYKTKKGNDAKRTVQEWDKTDQNQACNGPIFAEVKAVEEPSWGGTYPNLDIRYKCGSCGKDISHEKLPSDSDSLSDLLTTIVESL